MKKIATFIVLATTLYSCKKEAFTSYLESAGPEKIIEVQLHPNSPVLIADGQAALTFKVKAFMEIIDSEGKKDTVAFNIDKLKPEQIEITSSKNERIEGTVYKTSQIDNGSISFTANIGSITSKPVAVKLVNKPTNNFTNITVPINFHILHTPAQMDMANGISTEFLQGMVDRLNKVFSNTHSPNPVGVDSKIKFVLKQRIVKNVGVLTPPEVNKYILTNSVTEPLKTLNVWLCNTNTSTYTTLPAYKSNTTATIEGLNLTYSADPSKITFTNPIQAGIMLNINNIFNIAGGESPRIENVIGQFFGLLPTKQSGATLPVGKEDVDFCSDTYTYQVSSIRPEKWTVTSASSPTKIYYDSFNIMDETTASSTVSYEQVLRIRKVIANCPLRQFN
ncbi:MULTISPECIES: hypothetical protein [Sphingobacterium]|uniref:hypothetical protein n=1 Tax=Sphingobacterium TaxID=28453 RepID=UPI0013DAAE33|nr:MULTISPECIES: hypothetical protein [unclassified Sphingobacterium]